VTGFAAGTAVHTRDGLKPIEAISAGDFVLSQPEETGERAYKRVVRTVPHEDEPICRAYFWLERDGQSVAQQEVLATPTQPVHVIGYHNGGRFSDEYFDELDKPIGWRRAELLESHQVVPIANGETMHVGKVERLWRTRTPGEGWVEVNPDSTTGRIRVVDGRSTADRRPLVDADFAGVEDFNERNFSRELQDKWAYRCTVHDLEVEDFQTYYVGEDGVWVRGGTASRWLVFP
jgi:hypothetical protein